MFGYFWNGFQHAVFAVLFAIVFFRLIRYRNAYNFGFWIGLIMSSSALFFLPAHIGAFGSWFDWFYQFLHYPLADWDILILGMSWHRFFLTHSLIIPVILMISCSSQPKLYGLVWGIGIGLSSHLIWDAITGSMWTPIVFLSTTLQIRGSEAKSWLILNGVMLFLLVLLMAKRHTTKSQTISFWDV